MTHTLGVNAPPPAGGFSKFIFVADKLNLKISYSRRTIPTLTSSPPFPRFLGRQWKRRHADSGLFRIQPRAPPPAGGFQNSFSSRRIAKTGLIIIFEGGGGQ